MEKRKDQFQPESEAPHCAEGAVRMETLEFEGKPGLLIYKSCSLLTAWLAANKHIWLRAWEFSHVSLWRGQFGRPRGGNSRYKYQLKYSTVAECVLSESETQQCNVLRTRCQSLVFFPRSSPSIHDSLPSSSMDFSRDRKWLTHLFERATPQTS